MAVDACVRQLTCYPAEHVPNIRSSRIAPRDSVDGGVRIAQRKDEMPTTEMLFTCFDCCQTYSGPVDHPHGEDGDEEEALAHITGQPRADQGRGPICPKCLKNMKRQLSRGHFERCMAHAKSRATKEGKTIRIFSQHLRGKDGTAQGVWICSDGTFQEIPREAKTNRPRSDAWKPA
jgi:hypothetical protein